ncbi:hypothetical protein T11_16495 [Trichinella zimbabwensis]|uniref:Uncharacterized protein n=1 Tax=Trichinella zimbabwensis TaxID=268475 RepID=A0A0V1HAE6_9BILA|nr:hypothetical protein T11_16495 [Trichinella zimbabwensis]
MVQLINNSFCNSRAFHLDARCRGENLNDCLLFAFVKCRRWTCDLRNFASVGFQLLAVFDFCTLKIEILKFSPANQLTEPDQRMFRARWSPGNASGLHRQRTHFSNPFVKAVRLEEAKLAFLSQFFNLEQAFAFL